MGMVKIDTVGSFGQSTKCFSAMARGHAAAVAEAIKYLSEKVLPAAIANDHQCHLEDAWPHEGFGEPPVQKPQPK